MISTGIPIEYWDNLMAEDPRSVETAIEILRQQNKGKPGSAGAKGKGQLGRARQMSG